MTRPLTKREAADYLRVSERTLDRYRTKGLVRAVKGLGKVVFRPQDLEEFLAKSLEVAGPSHIGESS